MDISVALNTLLGSYPAAVAILVIGLGALIWKISASIKGIRDKVESVKDLPCKEHAAQLNEHSSHFSKSEALLGKLEGKIDMLVRLLPQATARAENLLSEDAPKLSQKNSPKVLNHNGEIVSDTFGCKEFLTDNADWLLSELSKFNPQTALDVEMSSLAALRLASSDERFNSLKDKIYAHEAIALSFGDKEEMRNVEISLDDVLFVISIPLRDLYLQKHPEITVS